MTQLRKAMIEAMQVHGFSPRTQESYLAAVTSLATYYHRSPDQITPEEIQDYFVYLVKERHLCDASCRLHLNGQRFFYLQVLHRSEFDIPIVYPKRKERIPELLTRAEIGRLIHGIANNKHRMMITLCYGCGLRVSELVAVKVRHIDGERHLLRVEQGKGGKDRLVIISDGLLLQLRHYWQQHRPFDWLFPGQDLRRCLSVSTPQKVYTDAKKRAGIQKQGGIHSLRHAYATNQLEDGLPVHQLQQQMGHTNIKTTLRYLHWVPRYHQSEVAYSDLVAQLGEAHG